MKTAIAAIAEVSVRQAKTTTSEALQQGTKGRKGKTSTPEKKAAALYQLLFLRTARVRRLQRLPVTRSNPTSF
jgi:hypothetical protein